MTVSGTIMWPIPPSSSNRKQSPQPTRCPRPVRLHREALPRNPMLMPAPSKAAKPTRKAKIKSCLAKAAADRRRSPLVKTDPCIGRASPACHCAENRRASFQLVRLPHRPAPGDQDFPSPDSSTLGSSYALFLRQVVQQLAKSGAPMPDTAFYVENVASTSSVEACPVTPLRTQRLG